VTVSFGSHARVRAPKPRPKLRRVYHGRLVATPDGHVLELRRGIDVIERDADGNVLEERFEAWRMPVVNVGDRLLICGESHNACALAEVTGFADADGLRAQIRRVPVEGSGAVGVGEVTCMPAPKRKEQV